MTPASFKYLDGRPAPSTRLPQPPGSALPGRAPAASPLPPRPTPILDALDSFSEAFFKWWEAKPWPWNQPPVSRAIGSLRYWLRNLAWDARDRASWTLARWAYQLSPRVGTKAQYQTTKHRGLAYTVAEFGWAEEKALPKTLPFKTLRTTLVSITKRWTGGLLVGLVLLASEIRS